MKLEKFLAERVIDSILLNKLKKTEEAYSLFIKYYEIFPKDCSLKLKSFVTEKYCDYQVKISKQLMEKNKLKTIK